MSSVRSALSPSPLPPRESTLLLAHVLGTSREWILAHPEAELNPEQRERFESLMAQAQSGMPLPYLLGCWEFFGLTFRVTPVVLIPRPETELLIEQAIKNPKSQIPNPKIADIGTGSGIIAVTLAVKLPHARIVATDVSPAALEVAKANAADHNISDRVTFIQSDLFSAFRIPHSAFDMICANLPYIATDELRTLPVAKHEPTLALDGGPDGLRVIERLLADAPNHLAPGGVLLAEIGAGQGQAALALARRYFPAAESKVLKDLAGLDRVLMCLTPHPGATRHPSPLSQWEREEGPGERGEV